MQTSLHVLQLPGWLPLLDLYCFIAPTNKKQGGARKGRGSQHQIFLLHEVITNHKGLMASMDYVPLSNPNPLGKARRALGLLLVGATGWLARHTLFSQSEPNSSSSSSSFKPKQGVDHVVLKPGSPGPAQLVGSALPTGQQGSTALFLCAGHNALPAFTQEEEYEEDLVQIYGARCVPGEAWLLEFTGRPDDRAEGRAFGWPQATFARHVSSVDALMKNKHCMRRAADAVRWDGSVIQVQVYVTPPAGHHKQQHTQQQHTQDLPLKPAAFLAFQHMRLQQELKQAKERSAIHTALNFVLGNEASDLDSVVSAVVVAWWLSHNTSQLYHPLLNIPRDELALRAEIPFALREAGLDQQHIASLQEVRIVLSATNSTSHQSGPAHRLILVDHNSLAPSQKPLSHYVTGVIDHHKDTQEFGEKACPTVRLVDTTGSCVSLVVHHMLTSSPSWLAQLETTSAMEWAAPFAQLIADTILLDTGNMSPVLGKVRHYDERALHWASGLVQAARFRQLLTRRNAVVHLTTPQLLAKDTKYGRVKYEQRELRYAIAQMGQDLRITLAERPHFFSKYVPAFAREHQLQVLLIMTTFSDAKDALARQLVLFVPAGSSQSAQPAPARLFNSLRTNLLDPAAGLQLATLDLPAYDEEKGSSVCAFAQHNVKASRKQILPLLEEFLSRLH
eukprot:g21627.t1